MLPTLNGRSGATQTFLDTCPYIRDRLLKTNYERFPENQLEAVTNSQKNAVWSSSISGLDQLAEDVALDKMFIDMSLDKMFIDMRVPAGPIRREAGQWWLDMVMNPDSDIYKELKALDSAGKLPPTREFYGS